jgi:succinylglutamic semialdehyde dehydrogenase
MMIRSIDPMTEDVLWEGKACGASEVGAAAALAKEAQKEWSCRPFEERAALLLRFRDTLKKKQDALALTISKETGKPLWESQAEVGAMIGKIDISIDAQKKRCPEIINEQEGRQSAARHKPIGVCAVLGPFNFPGHLPNGHIVPALLAGNTVVFKPSELTPLTAEEVLQIWKEAGLTEGLINVVQGGGNTGRKLVDNPLIDAVFFTGSWNTGMRLSEQLASRPDKMLALEMGGNNPLVLGDIQNPDAAAYLAIQSAYLTAGQRCTCARRIILQKKHQNVIDRLMQWIPQIHVGAYTDTPEPFMGPVINNEAADYLLSKQNVLQEMGGKLLIEMQRVKGGTPLLSPGLIDVTGVNNIPDEELFGPLLQVIRVPDFETAIEEANRTAYGLCATLLSDSEEEYRAFYQGVRAGLINWNTQSTGASSALPFGGVGRSGNFRPSAYYAADYCNYPVASQEVPSLSLPSTLSPGISL